MKILLNISFVGSEYCGYQVQKNGDTVQQRLNEAAKSLFGFDCDVVGCSRTDRGVHADMFCACINRSGETGIDTSIPEGAIPLAFNSYLPGDICVMSASYVDENFHPRYDVKYKEYIYKILNTPLPNPFLYNRVWHYPRRISDEMIKKMDLGAKQFLGRHDFASFMASGSSVKDTVREVFVSEVFREGDMICFRVSADGFLYNMVRIMTGTLVGIAEGKFLPEDIEKIIFAKDRSAAGITVPPQGLYLHKVVY